MMWGTFACIYKATEKLCKDRNGVVTCDKKNLPRFVVGYEFIYLAVCFISPCKGSGI